MALEILNYDYLVEEFATSPGSTDISASAGPVRKSLHAADYVVFVLLLVFSLGIGVYYAVRGEGQNSTNEYLMGRRRLQLIPVSISMFMSYISAILILGNAAEMYKYGAQYFLAVWGGVFATFVSSYLFIPMIYRLKLVSSFQVSAMSDFLVFLCLTSPRSHHDGACL